MSKDRIFGDDVKRDESPTHSFIKTVVHSLNPGKYVSLTSRTWKQAFDYLFTIVFFLVFALFLVSIYKFAHFQVGFDKEVAKFDKFDVEVDFRLSEPIEIGSFVIDNSRNYTDERILITQEGITTHSLFCLLLEPVCIFEEGPGTKTSEELGDALTYTSEMKDLVGFALVLLLPGLLMFFLVYYALKFCIFISLAFIIAFIVTRIARYEISLKQLYLAAIYSATVMVILEVINFYFMGFFWIPIIAYMIMFTIAVMSVGEREHAYSKEK